MAAREALSLYVHWPFCEAKCPYCDFNSHVRERVDARAYETALLAELDFFAEKTRGKALTSIFFGGGTPSLMPPGTAAAVIEKAKQFWKPIPDMEVTLEANPGSSEAKKFKAFKEAGINRLSLGVQSFDDDALKFLGRIHNAKEARQAIEIVRDTFPRFSFDLIYALPGQGAGAWRKELDLALNLAGGHLSLYQLTLELDTAFYRQHQRGKFSLPPEDQAAGLFLLTNQICQQAGLSAYETSNFAKPGEESRHNLNYWQGGAYAGIGPGAHSRLLVDGTWRAASTVKGPEQWLEAVGKSGAGLAEDEPLSPHERGEEIIMTALRLREGLDKKSFVALSGIPLEKLVNPAALVSLKDQGLVLETETRLALTKDGALLVNSILGELLT